MTLAHFRNTTQKLVPARLPRASGLYDLYPAFPIGAGKIKVGYDALAEKIARAQRVMLDGYGGVLWENFCAQLDAALQRMGIRAHRQNINTALYPQEKINELIAPFLGGDDPLFGTRFTGTLRDFFDSTALEMIQPKDDFELNIVYGAGAAFANWDAPIFYVDVPKNEIQFRARAGIICNLGAQNPTAAKAMYKRFYFVDWIALNQHKQDLLPQLECVIDEQRPDEPAFLCGDALRAGLDAMSKNYFRVRPWFEPGPWGGQWLKEHIPRLPPAAPNYAWSFELIAPENGLLLASDGNVVEVSFDFLMYHAHHAVLGECADIFRCEFPIRFDYLDTFDGGNLSLQCHPRLEYIRRHFGERFTQDETYYILDCKPDARVYLGFHETIDEQEFSSALGHCAQTGEPLDVEKFVHTEPAHRHDLFLIPNGTIHCSGVNNLVLEISATPYIFTFKLYDWLRLDLDGKPRALNLTRAFDNLEFARRGARIQSELIAQPRVMETFENGRLLHLPTHAQHFYDVHRIEFRDAVEVETKGSCHVLNLVQGDNIILETGHGMRQEFHYAETFVIPAAAEHYRLIHAGRGGGKIIKAFLKPKAVVEEILGKPN